MKKLFIALTVLVCISGCKKEMVTLSPEEIEALNPFGVEDSLLIKDTYIVYLNEEKYKPVLAEYASGIKATDSEELEKATNSKIEAIKLLGEKYGLPLSPEDIFVYATSAFMFQDTSATTIKKILSDRGKEDIEAALFDYKFYMQNTRARMQSGEDPLLQNTRARMQGEPTWGYDEVRFTSKAVLYLGGGNLRDTANLSKAKVWIIDSGIDSTHQDLKDVLNITLSKSFVKRDNSPGKDYWGHGTAVSGLIGAKPANLGIPNDSLIGMTGVSPGAELVSLKVFGKSEESRYSWVKKALQHIGQYGGAPGDIVNLSLGNSIRKCSQFGIFQDIQDMAAAGYYFSIAAGNAFDPSAPKPASQYLPACIEGERIFTIASVGLDYSTGAVTFSPFSNYGVPPVDWALPGSYIFTTYPENNKYAVMEGTSMSAALMSGLLHLTKGTLRVKTTVSDSQGNSYPIPEK